MNKKILATAVLALFLIQTQALAAPKDADVEREILSGKAQSSLPRADKKKSGSGVIWSRQEGDTVEMSPADREREILGKSQRSVVVPVDEWQTQSKDKKKKDKDKAQEKDGASPKDDSQPAEMHSSSMSWDAPIVNKKSEEKAKEESVESVKASGETEKSAKKESKKKDKKIKEQKTERTLAELERDRLGGKAQRSF